MAAFAKAFAGRWRIVEMDVWDKDFLDLVETAHLTFKGAADGEIAFGALKGFLDVRYGTRDDSACAEFTWKNTTNCFGCGGSAAHAPSRIENTSRAMPRMPPPPCTVVRV